MFLKSHTLILLGVLISAAALAEEHKAYVQFNAGAAFAATFVASNQNCFNSGCSTSTYKEDYHPGFAASIALGYHLTEQFRLEGEAMYQSNDRNDFHFTATSPFNNFSQSGTLTGERARTAVLLNGYYDFKNSTAFTPYITAGLGGYYVKLKFPSESADNDLDFAWQAGAGVNYKMNDRISFDLKYRYFGGADAELQNPRGLSSRLYEVGDHQVMAGIRVGF